MIQLFLGLMFVVMAIAGAIKFFQNVSNPYPNDPTRDPYFKRYGFMRGYYTNHTGEKHDFEKMTKRIIRINKKLKALGYEQRLTNANKYTNDELHRLERALTRKYIMHLKNNKELAKTVKDVVDGEEDL